MALHLAPVDQQEAWAFILRHHRHHQPPRGWKFGIAVADAAGELHGVVTVGRPVGRGLDDGFTAEVTRNCTDGTKNAASMLYAAAWRACRAMGYRRLITYILACEAGHSLKAAGWRELYAIRGRSWDTPSRPRTDQTPAQLEDKTLWQAPSLL